MIVLSARPLIQRPIITLPRLLIVAAITMFLLYMIYSFSKWYLYHPEGSYSLCFLSLAKKASLDEKPTYYNATISDMLLLALEQDHKIYSFVEKCPSVVNPSIDTIMRTPYKDIPALAKANITRDIFDYNQRLANISANMTFSNPTKMNSYLKWGLIVGSAVVSIVIGYCIYNYGSIALLKSLKTQKGLP